MRVAMVSTDRNIFKNGSAVRERMIDYGTICEELHIIIFSKRGFRGEKISSNVFLYPTNSFSRWLYIFDAIRIGKNLSKIDIVTAQDPFETGLAGWIGARFLGAKLHLQIHTDFLNPFFYSESLLNKIRVFLADFLLPKADGIRAVSKRISDSLDVKNYKLKTIPIVLPIFVDTEAIRKNKPFFNLHKKYSKFETIIFMASRLTKEKNITLALRVISRLIRENPGIGLVIAGDGPERHNLEARVIALGLRDTVVFEGWQGDLGSYYKGADIFLNTSNYEGLGLSLIEAAFSGCPVVTTDVGGVGDTLRKNEDVLACPVGDELCLAEQLDLLIKFPKLRKQIASRVQVSLVALESSKEEYLRKMRESWEMKHGLL